MKRTIINILAAAAAFAAAVSCQENLPEEEDFSVFTASIENGATKTTLTESDNVYWVAGDLISINGKQYRANSSGSVSTFNAVAEQATKNSQGKFEAYYPADVYYGTTPTLHSEVNYEEGSLVTCPMYAVSTNNSLYFHNICGVFEFTLTGMDPVKSITVSAYDGSGNNLALSGEFSVDENNVAVLTNPSAAANVTLNCGANGVQLTSEGKKFYVAIPVGTYPTINIAYTSTEGKEMTVTKHDVTVERSTIYGAAMAVKFGEYMHFTALEAGVQVGMYLYGSLGSGDEAVDLEYRINDGAWKPFSYSGGNTVTLPNVGDKIYFKGENEKFSKGEIDESSWDQPLTVGYCHMFTTTGKVNVAGDVLSLLDTTTKAGTPWALAGIFAQTDVVSARSLTFPSSTLGEGAFVMMFAYCDELLEAPETLPAETLSRGCYGGMFEDCEKLTTSPKLPATTLENANMCYCGMFAGCGALTTAPELPATTLSPGCYVNMFASSGLTKAPKLAATELEADCYACMFYECENLQTVQDTLPATTLKHCCYSGMYNGCTSLAKAPFLPAKNLAGACYEDMFYECENLATVQDTLPATALADSCYSYMFSKCSSLAKAPALPAETMEESCYKGMFSGCTSLSSAPVLPAESLVSCCYDYMFYGCSCLNYIKALFLDYPTGEYAKEENATYYWVQNVASSGTFVKNGDAVWDYTGVHGVPVNWNVGATSDENEGGVWE